MAQRQDDIGRRQETKKAAAIPEDGTAAADHIRTKTFGRLRRVESLRDKRKSGVLLHEPFDDFGQRYRFGPSAGMATEGSCSQL
jgi:hypothetical protein